MGLKIFLCFFCPRLVVSLLFHATQLRLETVQQHLLGRMARMSGAVSFVVPAVGISFITLKSRMKKHARAKGPRLKQFMEWNVPGFACWFVCLLFEIRAIWLSSAAGLSEQLICNITKWRLLFQKPRHLHCHYWFRTCSSAGELNRNSHIRVFFDIVCE